jgi:hypothetical protein
MARPPMMRLSLTVCRRNFARASDLRHRATLGLERDDRLNVVKKLEFQAAQYSALRRKTRMDTTTLLIIVLLVLLLGGGGWYGRGRWY